MVLNKVSPKLFNIYVNVLSTSLNEKYIGCCLKDKLVNHLYYADDLVLVYPTASGMNELIQECESFSTEYGLTFNESKTVLLYFKPDNFKINPCTSIKMNGILINVECSCQYLGHMITTKRSDNEDIKRQIRSFHGKANMLLRTFSQCSYHVKLQLFSSYCGSLYTCHLWCNYTVKQHREIRVAYNNVLEDWWVMRNFVVRVACLWRIEVTIDTRIRRLVYGFYQRLNVSENFLVKCVVNSSAWLSSKLYAHWNKCLYVSQIIL